MVAHRVALEARSDVHVLDEALHHDRVVRHCVGVTLVHPERKIDTSWDMLSPGVDCALVGLSIAWLQTIIHNRQQIVPLSAMVEHSPDFIVLILRIDL